MKDRKGIFLPSISAKVLICLLAGMSLTITACQRAKLKTVPRQESPTPGPGATDTTPDPEQQDPPATSPRPTPRPPVVVNPPENSRGEDGEPEPAPEDPVVTGGEDLFPVPAPRVEPGVPSMPVTQQPALPSQDRNVITWLDPNFPAHPSVLDACTWKQCQEPPAPPQPVEREAKSYTQTTEPITNLLDVMFVLDTSHSIDNERTTVARNVHRFTSEVAKISQRQGYNKELDVEFGVLLAHGPDTQVKSKYFLSAHGGLFVHPHEALSDAILSTKKHSQAEIQSALTSRFSGHGDVRSIRDKSVAQGEAGLLSLSRYIQRSQTDNPTGFPRDGAALMVIFISDENDVCFDYKTHNQNNPGTPFTPQVHSNDKVELAGILRDRPEHEAFTTICDGGNRGQASQVVNQLKNIKGYSTETHDNLPIIPTGILYRSQDDARAAQRAGGAYSGDNEMGHGYLDVISSLGGGRTTSLRDANIAEQMTRYGKNALFQLNFYNTLPIQTPEGDWVDFNSVSPSSVRVEVEVKAGAKAGQTITLIRGGDYNIHLLDQEEGAPRKAQILLESETESGINWHNAVIRIFYSAGA